MEVVSSPYKPLHFAGGYGHLRYRIFFAGPIHVPRGVPIEIEPVEEPAQARGMDAEAASSRTPLGG
jgi:hypothetical protein